MITDMVEMTIFTPTLNRGYTINNLYESIKRQTFTNFEWIIIDQGTDNTEKIIDTWDQDIRKKTIYLHKPEEKGINRAYNNALKLARGKLFFKVDSDDKISEDALQIIIDEYNSLKDKSAYCGVAGLRAYSSGKVIGGDWKLNVESIDASNFERKKYGLLGDKAECYFTKLLVEYGPMPEIIGETYTDEAILYNRIANAGYKLRWFNKVIYYTEYLADGITKNLPDVQKHNPSTYKLMTNEYIQYKQYSTIFKLKLLCRFFETARELNKEKEWAFDGIVYSGLLKEVAWTASKFTKNIKRTPIG